MYKENLGLVPSSNKRPKVTDLAMVGVSSPVRQPLSNFNAGPTPAPAADLNPGLDASAIDFNSREDVEMLLNEKMKGKNKNDYKMGQSFSSTMQSDDDHEAARQHLLPAPSSKPSTARDKPVKLAKDLL